MTRICCYVSQVHVTCFFARDLFSIYLGCKLTNGERERERWGVER